MAFSQNNSNVILCARSNDRCTQNDPVNIEINSRGINYNWISLLLHAAVKERNKIYEN